MNKTSTPIMATIRQAQESLGTIPGIVYISHASSVSRHIIVKKHEGDRTRRMHLRKLRKNACFACKPELVDRQDAEIGPRLHRIVDSWWNREKLSIVGADNQPNKGATISGRDEQHQGYH